MSDDKKDLKERITITISKLLLDDVEYTVDGVRVQNRSHAIEILIDEALEARKLAAQ